MRCAIVQPSYIPWRGFFDLLSRVDLFIFYDDVQYDRRGWRNRNRVKTPRGPQWLTIPVHARRHMPISAVDTLNTNWPHEHLATLTRLYDRAPHFEHYRSWLERVYAAPPRLLADFTIALTIDIAGLLGIERTRTLRASELHAEGTKSARLVEVLEAVGATHYLTGPTAKAYLDVDLLAAADISVEWMSYDHYPEYPQLYPPFDPHVTVLDLLFMTGDGARDLIHPGPVR